MESPCVVYKGNKHLELYAHFITLSQEIRAVQFVYYDSEEYDTQLGQLPSTRVMVHRGDQSAFKADVYEGTSYLELRDFIISKAFPSVVESNPKTLSLVHEMEIPALFLKCPDRHGCQPFIELLNRTSTKNHTLLRLVVFEERTANPKHSAAIEHSPQMMIMDVRRGHLHYHHMHESLTAEHLERFIDWYFGHRKTARHFSEHADCHKHHVVRKVTGHSYHKDIFNTHKLTMLLVHRASSELKQLLDSYEVAATQIHRRFSRHIKFRRLDQDSNLTPLKFYSKPTILIVFPTTSKNPESLIEVEVSMSEIATQHLADIITTHAHMSLDGLETGDQPIELDL